MFHADRRLRGIARRDVTGGPELRIGPAVEALRIYTRALRTSEVVGNWRARR